MNETEPIAPSEEDTVEEEEQRRSWLWPTLLLLLLSLCCLFASSQLAIISGIDQTIQAEIRPLPQIIEDIDQSLAENLVLPRLKPEIADEATADAIALLITPGATAASTIAILPPGFRNCQQRSINNISGG